MFFIRAFTFNLLRMSDMLKDTARTFIEVNVKVFFYVHDRTTFFGVDLFHNVSYSTLAMGVV
jgi:hypothetical protein